VSIVVVAEKPSVARDLGRVLGAGTRGDGVLTGNGYVVTWSASKNLRASTSAGVAGA
jgi:DNA topoisomerase-3